MNKNERVSPGLYLLISSLTTLSHNLFVFSHHLLSAPLRLLVQRVSSIIVIVIVILVLTNQATIQSLFVLFKLRPVRNFNRISQRTAARLLSSLPSPRTQSNMLKIVNNTAFHFLIGQVGVFDLFLWSFNLEGCCQTSTVDSLYQGLTYEER